MKLLICGGRDYDNYSDIFEYVKEMKKKYQELVIIQGGAKGADSLAKKVAAQLGIECREYKADWKRYGKGAGPKRNQEMIDEERPDLVVAFHPDIDSSKGTKDMVNRAKRHNISFEIIDKKIEEVIYERSEENLYGTIDENSEYKISGD